MPPEGSGRELCSGRASFRGRAAGIWWASLLGLLVLGCRAGDPADLDLGPTPSNRVATSGVAALTAPIGPPDSPTDIDPDVGPDGASDVNSDPAPAATIAAPAPSPTVITPFPGIRVVRDGEDGYAEFDAISTLREGWLEQVACTLGTREYESLVGTEVVPSQLHAALLLAGFEPGRPGGWRSLADGSMRLEAPLGDPVAVSFHWRDPETGADRTATPAEWTIGADGTQRMDAPRWIFGGSYLVTPGGQPVDPERANPDSVYVADWNGSVIGLVTFGDEVLGYVEVIPDAADLAPPAWMVDSAAVPPEGTPVRVRLRRPDDG